MKTARVIGLVATLAVIQITSVQAEQQAFIGEWINVNPATRGLTKLVISNDDKEWKIRAWGSCQPDDCDWETVKLHVLGSSVSDRSFKYGFAIWEPGFATKYMNLSKDGDNLRVELVTIFKENDKYRRSNSKHTFQMRRVE